MTSEEELYMDFYEKMENDDGKTAKKFARIGKYISIGTAFAAAYFGSEFVRDFLQDASLREYVFDGSMPLATAGLSIHFYDVHDIWSSMHKKKQGEEFTESDLNRIRRNGKIGRYSHMAGATSIVPGF